MKEILKPIFEMITGDYVMFDNIIYNFIIMTLIGVISFIIAWKIVGKLYKNSIITGRNIGSLLHWSARLIIFIGLFYVFSTIIWLTKFIYENTYIIFIILLIIITISIIFIIKNKKIEKC